MPSFYLDEADRVVRHVPSNRCRRDENDNVIGVNADAFSLRENEEYLSVTWCEFFDGTALEQLCCAVSSFKGSYNTKRSSHYWCAPVGSIEQMFRSHRARRLRVIHEPDPRNAAHVALRGWPRENDQLLEAIAAECAASVVVCEGDLVLAPDTCGVSARGQEASSI